MNLITFASLKGGAGKTTSLMAACGSLVSRGTRVGLFEADDNQPLHAWREYAQGKGTWNDACEIANAMDLAAFEQAYEHFETSGYDIALADTQGGGSEFNATIIASSDLIVIPSALTRLDLDSTLDTYAVVDEILEQTETPDIPVAILITQMPSRRLTSAQSFCLDIIEQLPSFDCTLPYRSAFADIKSLGMLHIYREALSQIPSKRIAATHITTAIADADRLADTLLEALEAQDAHP
ncbi:virulence protein (plasmid) [Roseobacter denitrificans]|uniref:VirC1 n=1 Tax=Roseobacter denitrificans (strain ATCC 33942 / OCh 114) TaxID=375451 RepID=Q07GJ4_ROSDO|nr:conjugal transfer ATPase VirC1 [Roseobacter denitrificans]ABI93405.1 virC1 [Roseobacter denitrificans OCh 114]AVL51234.1 virulence protein [Roseobacter denitrificans]SFG40335.1 Cellulose biosynthesis protein BcsQ [Roseobacter denitrificans OCh 114]